MAICFDKLNILSAFNTNKENIYKFIINSNNSSSSSSKNVVETKTATTYISTLERLFETDFLLGSTTFTSVFKNDNPVGFIKKKHILYDKTNESKSNNVQPALKKLFEWMKHGSYKKCNCEKCFELYDILSLKVVNTTNFCENCMCGDPLHCNKQFGCHMKLDGEEICFGLKKCSNCKYYLPCCSFDKMIQNVTEAYELENIIKQDLYLCNKCVVKCGIKKTWGHQKNATTLHKSFYHGKKKMMRKRRKLITVIPKNNEITAVKKDKSLAPHKKTVTYLETYYNNLKGAIKWVKEQKSLLEQKVSNFVKNIDTKIQTQQNVTQEEAMFTKEIVANYEVTDKDFIKFIDKKQNVLIPKKNERIELRFNKRHIVKLKRKRKRQMLLTQKEVKQRQSYLEMWGFGRPKKKKRLPKHKKSQIRRITDNFETCY